MNWENQYESYFNLNSNGTNKPKNIIFFFPGLNLSYKAFREMESHLRFEQTWNIFFKHDPNRSLYNEIEIINKAIEELIQHYKDINIYNIGHSYGSLISLNLAKKYNQVKKNILIAPALEIRKVPETIESVLSRLPKRIMIPSLNFSGYGQRNSLPISIYHEMKSLRHSYLEKAYQISCPSLIILDEKDVIISHNKVLDIVNKHPHWEYWQTLKNDSLSSFNHLPIDSSNLGNTGFQSLIKEISNFFSLK